MRHQSWTSLLLAVLMAIGAASLTACGGGGGPVIQPPGPVDPVDPVDPPGSAYSAGPYAISGIDRIPQDMVKLTREEMQRLYVIADGTESHARQVGTTACRSYVQSGDCDNQAGKIRYWDGTVKTEVGTSPFTKIVYDHHAGRSDAIVLKREDWATMDRNAIEALFESIPPSERDLYSRSYWASLERGDLDNAYGLANHAANEGMILLGMEWQREEIRKMGGVKIVSRSVLGSAATEFLSSSYLTIHATGNGAGNAPWYDDIVSAEDKVEIERAIAEDRLIFVSGWDRDANGNYVRHEDSDSCRGEGIRDGCIWTQYWFPDRNYYVGGTSNSTTQFAAALASVLAISPDTTPENLARFGKACVKKAGEGIEELLRVSGGLGVADFACVGDVVTALTNLPGGGTTNLTINGKPVTLSGRAIVLSIAEGPDVPEERDGLFFNVVPNGEETVLFITGYRNGELFALLSAGTRDHFFGFAREHRNVREKGVAAGHENLFFTLTEQHSDGGSMITEASGRSLTVTAQEIVALTGRTTLTATARADRFLGGEATIPLGTVDLSRGGWTPSFSLAFETALAPRMSFRTKAEMTDNEDYILKTGVQLGF